MYCHNCGKKIRTGMNTCPDCGNPVDENSYCGGFWGLVREPMKMENDKSKAGKVNQASETVRIIEKEPEVDKRTLLLGIVSIVLTGLVFVLTIVNIFSVNNLKSSRVDNSYLAEPLASETNENGTMDQIQRDISTIQQDIADMKAMLEETAETEIEDSEETEYHSQSYRYLHDREYEPDTEEYEPDFDYTGYDDDYGLSEDDDTNSNLFDR